MLNIPHEPTSSLRSCSIPRLLPPLLIPERPMYVRPSFELDGHFWIPTRCEDLRIGVGRGWLTCPVVWSVGAVSACLWLGHEQAGLSVFLQLFLLGTP